MISSGYNICKNDVLQTYNYLSGDNNKFFDKDKKQFNTQRYNFSVLIIINLQFLDVIS